MGMDNEDVGDKLLPKFKLLGKIFLPVLISQSEPLLEPGGVGGRPGETSSLDGRFEDDEEEELDKDDGELILLFKSAANVKLLLLGWMTPLPMELDDVTDGLLGADSELLWPILRWFI